MLDVILDQPLGERFVMLALDATDRRVREGKPVSPGFLFATLLWNEVLVKWDLLKSRGEPVIPALFLAMDEVLDVQAEKLAITRRIAGDIRDIWALQPRFEQRSANGPTASCNQPRFKAGYDFLLLRAESGEVAPEVGTWWTDFLHASDEGRADMLLPQPPGEARKRRRRRPPSGSGASLLNEPGLRRAGRQSGRSVAQVRGGQCCPANVPDSRLLRLSSLYRTAPVGIRGQPDFINAVAALATRLPPPQLLDALFAVERRFGRRREFYQAPRTLDLDLLLYDELVVDSLPLSVPHPRMHLRAFVLAPLLEIAPHCRIPGRGSAVAWLPAVSMQRIENWRLNSKDFVTWCSIATTIAPTITVVGRPSRDHDQRWRVDIHPRHSDKCRRFGGNNDASSQTGNGKKSEDKNFHGVLQRVTTD
ncbi:MAG: 2-amino-4-hydroxy-6-hydroxymethyldihydropteridine diphosphokinase [Candidatus Accumulibacter sp.]|nr:2-amino-4-hydroxy-6-hydroxymethyldihydropteridine diphosphokinase [Accumulibacter sp.]